MEIRTNGKVSCSSVYDEFIDAGQFVTGAYQ
jgi:hypothetical protein